MSILKDLLKEVKSLKLDEQLRVICDEIFKEEVPDPDEYEGPQGANIFLSIPVVIPQNKKHAHFICLEREAAGAYIVSYWSNLITTEAPPKRHKAWDIKNDDPQKILKEFVERLQFLKGE